MKAKNKFVFKPDDKEYIISLKKNNLWWLLLLLLLPLLLLVKCNKEIDVKTSLNNTPVPNTTVNLKYIDYRLFNFDTKKFFTHDTVYLTEQTDSLSVAKFQNIEYTLYSRILFASEKAVLQGTNKCFYGDSTYKFHKLKSNPVFNLILTNRSYNYDFLAVNLENDQPIPNAKITATATVNGQTKTWEANTEPDGTVYFENIPYCGEIKIIASAYGYYDDSIIGNANILYNGIENRTLKLRPLKKMIPFYTKDKNTGEAIAFASGTLTIDNNDVQQVKTNINGYGEFSEQHILKNFTILAQKEFYADTTKSDRVDKWLAKSDSAQTLFMRPTTQSLRFRNTDGRNPLPGVKNVIYVNGKRHGVAYSNNNGYFYVSNVNPDDKISIVASKPGYITNDFTVKNKTMQDLKNGSESGRTIPLKKKPQPAPPPPKDNTNNNNDTNDEIPPNVVVQPCESPQESGGQGVTTRVHSIGNSHRFTISWDMYNVPDQLIVYCGTGASKKQIFSTRGPVSGKGTASLYCKSNYITVKIIGQQSGTQWKYKMNCQ